VRELLSFWAVEEQGLPEPLVAQKHNVHRIHSVFVILSFPVPSAGSASSLRIDLMVVDLLMAIESD
jgi:hypothetical protein